MLEPALLRRPLTCSKPAHSQVDQTPTSAANRRTRSAAAAVFSSLTLSAAVMRSVKVKP